MPKPTLTKVLAPTLTGLLVAAASSYEITTLGTDEAKLWTRWLLPLPKEIRLTGKATVPVAEISLVLPADAAELERCAADELAKLLAHGGEVAVPVTSTPDLNRFCIALERAALPASKGRPNPDQAYALTPLLDASGKQLRGLSLSGATPTGLYYASKTLQQLLSPTLKGAGSLATVDMPVLTITDWPDLEERGEWGGTASEDLEWRADRKFNLLERHAELTLDGQGVGQAVMKAEVMERARTHGVRVVPIIHHLEQLQGTGMFERYPNLKAVGVKDSLCFAQPEATKLVSEWLTALGKIDGVKEVMIWLSEEGKGCECEQCKLNDRFVNETRVCLAAWQQAKQTCPNLGLRLLLTQASYNSNDKILAEIPEGVKVSYYHGGLTYDASRREMIYPLLQDYIERGRWLGVYPTVSASWLSVAPFSNPYFIKYRMTEFVDKGLKCLVAYAVPANGYYYLNVEAAAEWSWNAHGRDEREFAAAWATRMGIRQPDRFAEWTATLSPVSWDVYGSSFPYREHYGGTDAIIRGDGIPLGTGIFFEFKREEQFDEDLAKCDAALKLAEEIGYEPALLETKIVQAYARILKSVWVLSKLVHGTEVKAEDRARATEFFDFLQDGARTVVDLMPRWGEIASPLVPAEPAGRFTATSADVDRLAGRVGALMEACGLEDKDKPYRLRVIGTWDTPEFADQQSQTRSIDVTQWVSGPGTYLLQFTYKSGTLGLTASQVALISHPKDNPNDTREECVDKHDCHAGAWAKGDVYMLDLKEHDPERTYLLAASIRGGNTTQGEILFRKKRPEAG